MEKIKVSLRRVRLNAGGYDSAGAYWGVDVPGSSIPPLFSIISDCGRIDATLRAATRERAKAAVRAAHPQFDVRFYH